LNIDAHFHLWRLARADYGWLTPALAPIYRDVEVDDWRAVAAPLGVTGGVVVQAAPTEDETRFLLGIASASPDVLGVVGWADLLAGDAPTRIAQLAREPRLKALRPMLQDIADPDWILQPALGPALEAMAERGLVFDALVRPIHLPRVRELARRHPNLAIVIDHGAKPDIAAGQWEPWASEMVALARDTALCCKLSGLLTEAGDRASDPGAIGPWIAHLLDTFGPDRLLWGSDWPVLELAGHYAPWWTRCQASTAHLTAAQRDAIFGGNARRVYRLAPAEESARAFKPAE
jgi:L-fuconolactonase